MQALLHERCHGSLESHPCTSGRRRAAHRLRLPKPMRPAKRSSSKPPATCSRRCRSVAASTSAICARQDALPLIARSCRAAGARVAWAPPQLPARTARAAELPSEDHREALWVRVCRCCRAVMWVSHSVLHDGHACAVATARAARRAGHLGQGDKEGPRVGGQVARGRQVAVHLPALRKLLQPVVEFAADDHLRPGAPAARRTRRPAVTAPAAAAQPPLAARARCAVRGVRR